MRIITKILIVIGLLVLGMVLVTMWQAKATFEAGRIMDRNSLWQIGCALRLYAADYGGWSPAIEPHARRLANAAGVPAGCVLTFQDEDGSWKKSGLGLLLKREYVDSGSSLSFMLYCYNFRDPDGNFRRDRDEPFFRTPIPGPTDRDGIGELPGHPDVIVSSWFLRYNTDNPWGSFNLPASRPKGIITSLLKAGPTKARAYEPLYYIFFSDGSIRQWNDEKGIVREILGKENWEDEDVEATIDKVIFSKHLDSASVVVREPAPPQLNH